MRPAAAGLVAGLVAIAWTGAGPGPGGTVRGVVRGPAGPADDAVVYLVPEGAAPPPAPGTAVAEIDQRRLRFVPRVLAVSPGTSVAFRNSDPLLHNIFSPDPREPFDLGTYPQGESRAHRFEHPGPHVILCNIHPEMEAWVFVAPTPYHAVTDSAGGFRIGDLPPGDYALHVWRRHAAPYSREVTVTAADSLTTEIRLERETG